MPVKQPAQEQPLHAAIAPAGEGVDHHTDDDVGKDQPQNDVKQARFSFAAARTGAALRAGARRRRRRAGGKRLALLPGQVGAHVLIERAHPLGEIVLGKVVDIVVNQLTALAAGERAVNALARANLHDAVTAGQQHDHAVVLTLRADAPGVDDVGCIVRRIHAVQEIHDDGNGLYARRTLERGAGFSDGLLVALGEHRAVKIIGIGERVRLGGHRGQRRVAEHEHEHDSHDQR